MRSSHLLVIAVLALACTASSAARTVPTDKPVYKAKLNQHEAQLQRQLRSSARSVGNFRTATFKCQDTLGVPRTRASASVWALPRSLGYRNWAAGVWKARAASCERRLARHTIPDSHDWLSSIRWVQYIYPGTYDWLYWTSDGEGGHGAWVWYGGGHWHGYHIGNDFLGADTVGGNLQFRYSTFAPYWRATYADLRKRGYIVPEFKMPPEGGPAKYAAWLSPMGQALTGAFMRYTGKSGHHWG